MFAVVAFLIFIVIVNPVSTGGGVGEQSFMFTFNLTGVVLTVILHVPSPVAILVVAKLPVPLPLLGVDSLSNNVPALSQN